MIDINKGADIIIRRWLKLKPGEYLTIITDDACRNQANAIAASARQTGGKVNMILIPKEEEHGSSILDTVPYSRAIEMSDVIIGATTYSLITSKKINEVTAAGHRYLSLPLATNNGIPMLSFNFITMPPDEARAMAERIKQKLHECRTARVTTTMGTDIVMDLSGRWANWFTGDFSNGTFCDSSCFEVYTAPIETGTNGIMVVDGSFGYLGKPCKPLKITFKEGRIVHIEDTSDGYKLSTYIKDFNDPNMLVAAELGLGMNKCGRCDGNCYIEDESAYGTFHIGMGRNITLGGVNDATGHFDLVCHRPTVFLDDEIIVDDGEIAV